MMDIEEIRKSPRQFVDIETVEWLSDRVMVLEMQLAAAQAREAELVAHVERLRGALYKCQLFKLNQNNVQAVVNSALSATPAQSLAAIIDPLNAHIEQLEAECDELKAALVAVSKCKAIFNMYPSRNKSRSYGAVVADAIANGEK